MVSHQQHFLLLLCSCNYQTLEQLPVIFWVFYFSEVLWMLPTQLREKNYIKKNWHFLPGFNISVSMLKTTLYKSLTTTKEAKTNKNHYTVFTATHLIELIANLSKLCKGNLLNEQRRSSSIVLGEFVRYFERTLVIFVLIAYNFWQYFFSTDLFQRKKIFSFIKLMDSNTDMKEII